MIDFGNCSSEIDWFLSQEIMLEDRDHGKGRMHAQDHVSRRQVDRDYFIQFMKVMSMCK